MNGVISAEQLGWFFAWAPLVLGVVIYLVAYFAKREELRASALAQAAAAETTYACANCGKRATREHMHPQTHEGAVSYYCANCAR